MCRCRCESVNPCAHCIPKSGIFISCCFGQEGATIYWLPASNISPDQKQAHPRGSQGPCTGPMMLGICWCILVYAGICWYMLVHAGSLLGCSSRSHRLKLYPTFGLSLSFFFFFFFFLIFFFFFFFF